MLICGLPSDSVLMEYQGIKILTKGYGKSDRKQNIRIYPRIPRDKSNITIHPLLTHTSGLVNVLGDDYEEISKENFIKKAMASTLLFEPGEKYEYSNIGYNLLGIVIEYASGTAYEDNLYQYLSANVSLVCPIDRGAALRGRSC